MQSPTCHDIVVIGASRGGVEALSRLVRNLPSDLPAALFVVLHTSPGHISLLPEILNRAGPLEACQADDMQPIEHGRIYIAPPDRHLLVEPGRMRLSRGPKEKFTRPAANPLFRSAASAYGPRVLGIVLTGGDGDGTAGLVAIKAAGGISAVQDPNEASDPSMPHTAIAGDSPDYCLPLDGLANLIVELCRPMPEDRAVGSRI